MIGLMTDKSSVKHLIYKVISGTPFEVVDEETYQVYSSLLWELCEPRSDGDYAGSRIIGSGNLMTALNISYSKCITSKDASVEASLVSAKELLNDTLNALAEDNLIRHKPEKIRQTFKVVK